MAGNESAVNALMGLGEAGQSAELAQGGKQLLPPGEGLMDIALVAHVEHQPVPLRVKYLVDGHRQFHGAQVGCQMAAGTGNIIYQELPQLPAERRELPGGQRVYVGGRRDGFENQILLCAQR